MAGYAGSVGLTGYVAPKDTLDTYAIQDEKFNRGGYRAVADITERDAITADRRKEGMLVYVISEDKFYSIHSGLSNSDWYEKDFGGGGADNILTADVDYYVDGTNGDNNNDGLSWANAKKSLSFLDSLPHILLNRSEISIFLRNDPEAYSNDFGIFLEGFIGEGWIKFIGEMTIDSSNTISNPDYNYTTENGRFVWTLGSSVTADELVGKFVKFGTEYYPIIANDTTTFTTPVYVGTTQLADGDTIEFYTATQIIPTAPNTGFANIYADYNEVSVKYEKLDFTNDGGDERLDVFGDIYTVVAECLLDNQITLGTVGDFTFQRTSIHLDSSHWLDVRGNQILFSSTGVYGGGSVYIYKVQQNIILYGALFLGLYSGLTTYPLSLASSVRIHRTVFKGNIKALELTSTNLSFTKEGAGESCRFVNNTTNDIVLNDVRLTLPKNHINAIVGFNPPTESVKYGEDLITSISNLANVRNTTTGISVSIYDYNSYVPVLRNDAGGMTGTVINDNTTSSYDLLVSDRVVNVKNFDDSSTLEISVDGNDGFIDGYTCYVINDFRSGGTGNSGSGNFTIHGYNGVSFRTFNNVGTNILNVSPKELILLTYTDGQWFYTNIEKVETNNWRWDTEYLQAQTTAQQMPENFGVFQLGAFTKSSGDGVADYYLPKIDYDNFNLYTNIILVKHRSDNPEGTYENIRILPETATGNADDLYDAKGNPLSEVVLKPGETAIFQCLYDDPMEWYFYGKLGEEGSNGTTGNWEDIPTNSSIRDEGYYFSYGDDREITIQNDGSNRVINVKVVTGNCILKNDEGIFDSVTQDLQLSTGSAIKIACKEDDTYWILNEY